MPAARRQSGLILVVLIFVIFVRLDNRARLIARRRRFHRQVLALQLLPTRDQIRHLVVRIRVRKHYRHPRLSDLDICTDAPRVTEYNINVHRVDPAASVPDVPTALCPRKAGATRVRIDGIDLPSAMADGTAGDGSNESSRGIGLQWFRSQTTYSRDRERFLESGFDGAVQECSARGERQQTVLGERGEDLGTPEVGGHFAEAAAAEGISLLVTGTPSAPVLSCPLDHNRRPTHIFINRVIYQRTISLEHRTLLNVERHLPLNARLEPVAHSPTKLADHADVVLSVLFGWDAACVSHFRDVEVEVRIQRALHRVNVMAENAPYQHGGLDGVSSCRCEEEGRDLRMGVPGEARYGRFCKLGREVGGGEFGNQTMRGRLREVVGGELGGEIQVGGDVVRLTRLNKPTIAASGQQ